MNTHLISYASNRFTKRIPTFSKEVRASGFFDAYKVYSEDDLSAEFIDHFSSVLSQKRGGGYWIWKLFCVKQYMSMVNDGDIIFYVDSGCAIGSSEKARQQLSDYVDLINQHDMLRYSLPHLEKVWTNSTALNFFTNRYQVDMATLKESHQLVGGIFGFKKCKKMVGFFDEAIRILYTDAHLFTDKYNLIGQDEGFLDHRHDQSILSCLSKCLGIGYIIEDNTWFPDLSAINMTDHLFLAARKKK